MHGLLAPGELPLALEAQPQRAAHAALHRLGDQDLARLRELLEPVRDVHGVADGGEVGAPVRADVADDDGAGVDADADRDRRGAPGRPARRRLERSLRRSIARWISTAQVTARSAWSGCGIGAPK